MGKNNVERAPRNIDPEAEKRAQLEALCEGKPDAIYVLSGITKKTDDNTGEVWYKPGSYADVDWNDYMTYGKANAVAALELAEQFPDSSVAVNSSTYSISDEAAPDDADVMGDYLARRGVDKDRLVKQNRSTSTFTELLELIKQIDAHGWEHPVVVASELQRPRAEEMLRQIENETLKDPDGAWEDPMFQSALQRIKERQDKPKVTFVDAESVLPLRDQRYGKLIEEARKTENYRRRAELDQKAVDDLKAGRYWSKS